MWWTLLVFHIHCVLRMEGSHLLEGTTFNRMIVIYFYFPCSRIDVLFQHGLMKEQPYWVPEFTEIGFKKVIIPAKLYEVIVDEYEKAKADMEQEGCVRAVINCQEIKDLGDESVLESKRRTFMMQLRCFSCIT